MKFPKNRANVYVVMRMGATDQTVCGVFANYDDAEDFAGACKQEWYEKTGTKLKFEVVLSTFYG
jgi:hypothetical protein